MKRILIIGGSDAGISSALRAREVYPIAGITMAVPDKYPNSGICGAPFHLGGEVLERETPAQRSAEEIEKMGIRVFLEHRATRIDPEAKSVEFLDGRGRARRLPYDRLILAPGSATARPPFPGTDLPGVFFLRRVDDAFSIKRHLSARRPKSAVIIGSGPMGIEMADAMTRKGLGVTMLVRSGRILESVDPRLQEIVRAELSRNGVNLIDRSEVSAVEEQDGSLVVRNQEGLPVCGDVILIAAGTRPETHLAGAAGIPIGSQGAICVNRAMETGVEGVYAAGECAETWHRILGRNVYLPLGTTAHRQGRVAGENAAGGRAEFPGTLGTQALRVFDLVIARTGLKESEARVAGFDPLTAECEAWDYQACYPGATPVRVRITGDRKTRRLLGAQMVGHHRAEVSKRIDTLAAALSAGMSVDEVVEIDLSYSPPVSGTWDPVQTAALAWARDSVTRRAPLLRPGMNCVRDGVPGAEEPCCLGKELGRPSVAV